MNILKIINCNSWSLSFMPCLLSLLGTPVSWPLTWRSPVTNHQSYSWVWGQRGRGISKEFFLQRIWQWVSATWKLTLKRFAEWDGRVKGWDVDAVFVPSSTAKSSIRAALCLARRCHGEDCAVLVTVDPDLFKGSLAWCRKDMAYRHSEFGRSQAVRLPRCRRPHHIAPSMHIAPSPHSPTFSTLIKPCIGAGTGKVT